MLECGEYDVLIIGAGIVGSTIARALSRYRLRVAVLDRASELPFGQTRANSSMIHGGFDDKPGSVKARFCAKGNQMYHALHEELDFRFRPCGSYVCAIGEAEHPHLEKLLEQGRANGARGLEIISGDRLREREPHTSPAITAALWCSSAAIANNFEASLAFLENACQNGAELFLETTVQGLLVDGSARAVRGVLTNRGEFLAPAVINAAGVNSDVISRMAGDDSFMIHPTRGEYFIFDRSVGHLTSAILFACPSEHGKGITVTRTADENLLIGPTSVRQLDRDDRDTTPEGLEAAFEGAARLVPGIPRGMAITTFSGVRANSDSGDYYIRALDDPRGFVNVAGIKSPGLTSAPAIAEHVVDLMKDSCGGFLTFEPDPSFVPERRHIPRFFYMSTAEREAMAAKDPNWGQIVCRCESVTEGQVIEAIRRGARTVTGVKLWVRPGMGRCQGGFCAPRVVEILARELGVSPLEITRHGGDSHMLTGRTKAPLLIGESI